MIKTNKKFDFSVSQQDLEKQNKYKDIVRTVLSSRFQNTSPKAYVHTYGCQGNVADGEIIKGLLCEMGYELTDEISLADLVLYNTCAIREHAQDRVFGNVGKLKQYKEKKPEMIIALCGCMMQQKYVSERIKENYPFVDLVFGTHVLYRIPEFIYRCLCTLDRVFETPDSDGNIVENMPIKRDGVFKAWVPIIYGCDNFCSYCVVPYVRGRERSRDFTTIVDECRHLVESGYKEITLLGQNVNSYNKNMDVKYRFPALLKAINDIPGDFIIRFMTSHPKDCTHELIETMAQCKKVEKHLHLPVQSGNNRVLKEMNRRYDREKYLSLIEYAYSLMPGLAVTSDIIVGFPGETYNEFCDTLSLVKQVKFSSLFTFIFSARPGTKAFNMPDVIPYEDKSKWFLALTDLQEQIANERNRSLIGKTVRVLVEEKDESNDICRGKTSANDTVEFNGSKDLVGEFSYVQIKSTKPHCLIGELKQFNT